jgi:hypothetical protein
MQPHEFNEWRAIHDIPVLFEQFEALLPGFKEWTETLPFNRSVMHRIVPTGALFKGDTEKLVIERGGDFGDRVYECYDNPLEDAESYWKTRNKSAKVLGAFEPYFLWAKRTLGRKRFVSANPAYKARITGFRYSSWDGITASDGFTRARLFPNFPVLKLGQTTLLQGVILAPRNLDFTDIDFLTITGDWHGSYWLTISFSSCRGVTFSNARFAFCTFYQCYTDNLAFQNSKLQDLYFDNTDVQELALTDTYAFRLGFAGSRITPFISNCELREVSFKPASHATPNNVATTFRLLRSAFQSSGMRREASECYYKERIYERKAYFRPYLDDSIRHKLPWRGHASLLALYRSWEFGQISTSDVWLHLRKLAISEVQAWLIPKYTIRTLIFKIRWLMSMVECAMWGYGERPFRIFVFAFLVIGVYAGIFHCADWGNHIAPLNWINSLYFSSVTFTTLGYGDIIPTTTILKLLCSSEALLGAFTMGLVVAGFAGRSKY